jgi:hypothetical protein
VGQDDAGAPGERLIARMRIRVETYAGHRGAPMPRRFYLGRARVGVAETIDQWYGPDYRYIKVKGEDGSLYILRFHDVQESWELTMFKSVRAQSMAAPPPLTKRHM